MSSQRAAVYLRVSTDRQSEVNQEPECLQICTQRGWEPIVFREVRSGAKKRPQWDAVKELARRGKVQAVVFWSLHRTGRNKVQIAQDIRDLVSYKVRVVSVMQSWLDAAPESPLTGLLVDIMGFFAEGEREELIERTRRGLGRAKAAGRIGGRPRAVDLETVELASAKVLAGMSWSEVARELGVKPQTLRTACIRRNAAPV